MTAQPPDFLAATRFSLGRREFRFFHTDEQDDIFQIIRKSGHFYEMGMLHALGQMIAPGDLVVDVGANIGNHSIYFAGVCGARVVAIEPDPAAVRILKRNIAANGLEHLIEVRAHALGNAPQSAGLGGTGAGDPDAHSPLSGEAGDIPVLRLDDIELPAVPRLLKVDVEGMDREVLEGARQLLAKTRPVVAFEAADWADFNAIAARLHELGFVHHGTYNATPSHVFLVPPATTRGGNAAGHAAGPQSEAQQAEIARLDARLDALEKTVLAGLEAQLRTRLWLDERLTILRQAVSDDADQRTAGLLDEVRATVQQALQGERASLGAFFGDLLAEMDRRAARREPPATPPHRDFFALPEHDPREIVPYAPLASIPVTSDASPAGFRAALQDLARFDLDAGWEGQACAVGDASLDQDGTVHFFPGSHAGIRTALFDATGGGVIRLQVDVADLPDGAALAMRVLSESEEQWGPDFPLTAGANEAQVFAPARTQRLQVEVFARDVEQATCLRLRNIDAFWVDPDENQRRVGRLIGAPVIASMASIPARAGMLEDSVRSLLAQCDKVRVFLNGYTQVPAFLAHPRVEVRCSQDWDDRGDAGKFHWIDHDDEEGFRIVADDDLIFPPDFAAVMAKAVAARDGKAIYSAHGVLLLQPIEHYYENRCRAATFHFAGDQATERTVHIGGTGVMCFHSSAVTMRSADFRYCNSGDVWLALYAQKHGLPIITIPRPYGWIRENNCEASSDTIYDHSLRRTRSRFDSSLVQDAVIRHAWPITTQPTTRPKLCIAFVAEDAEHLAAAAQSWLATRSVEIDWVVMIVGSEEGISAREMAADLIIEHELHLIDEESSLARRLSRARNLAKRLSCAAMLTVTGAVRFDDTGWEASVFAQPQASASTWAMAASGSSAKLIEMPFGNSEDASSARVELFAAPDLPPAPASPAGLTLDPAVIPARRALYPAHVVGTPNSAHGLAIAQKPARSVNEMFERTLVINLDRRPDRWQEMQGQLDRVGIAAERVSAVDGSLPEVRAEYDAYAAQPLVPLPDHVRDLEFDTAFYINAPCQVARVAQLEHARKRKAIASAGAWGYLRTYRSILEKALADQVETLLILDDDVLFHRNLEELFGKVAQELPQDWQVLQLGTLQHNWSHPWFEPVSGHLYRTNGAAIGSHAVGLRFEAIASILDHVSRMDLPFDIGALSAMTQAFPDQCFVTLPNLAIQRLGRTSDINTSRFQETSTIDEVAARYRWNLADYPDAERGISA